MLGFAGEQSVKGVLLQVNSLAIGRANLGLHEPGECQAMRLERLGKELLSAAGGRELAGKRGWRPTYGLNMD